MSRYRVRTEPVMHSYYIFACADQSFQAKEMTVGFIESAQNEIDAAEMFPDLYGVSAGLHLAVVKAEHVAWVDPVAEPRS